MQFSPSLARRRAARTEIAGEHAGVQALKPATMWRWMQAVRLTRRLWRRLTTDEEAVGGPPRLSGRLEMLFLLSALGLVASALAGIVAGAGSDHYLIFVFAGAAGAFGATASILWPRGAHSSTPLTPAASDEPSWSSLALRVGVGAAAACLFYWLARMGVLGGGPFPALSQKPVPLEPAAAISVADFTKLMLGCFAAGFAERTLRFIRPKSADRN